MGEHFIDSQESADTLQSTMPPPSLKKLLGPLLGLLSGVIMIFSMSFLDRMDPSDWKDAVFVVGDEAPWDGMTPFQLRQLGKENFPGEEFYSGETRQALVQMDLWEKLSLDKHERVVKLYLEEKEWNDILESGRLPQPGKPEVLAGYTTRFDSFVMDGTTFNVVGQMKRDIACFNFSYLIPGHDDINEYFSYDAGGATAWLDPVGLDRIKNEEGFADTLNDIEIVSGLAFTKNYLALATLYFLLMVALCGSIFLIRLFKMLARFQFPYISPVFDEIHRSDRLLIAMHFVMYAVFFGSAIAAIFCPLAVARLVGFVGSEFSEGSLSYVGAAYETRNILTAATATFIHNFITATVGYTFLPSLVIPFLGLLKNLMSFAVIGFAMSPVLKGSATSFTYHSITMVIEFEAYILVCFIITIWPISLVRGVMNGEFASELVQSLKIMMSGLLLSGIILAIAAFYEATTLILFN